MQDFHLAALAGTPRRWKGPDTEGTSRRNHSFTIRTVSPSADMAGAVPGPTLTGTLIRGLRGVSGVVTPENPTQMPSGIPPLTAPPMEANDFFGGSRS
jgi:hypothetical protein